MNAKTAQVLPPKMAQFYAELAMDGKADVHHGGEHYSFYRGGLEITLISINPPIGHCAKRNWSDAAAQE